MKYVLDASVGLKWVLIESDSAIASKLRDESSQGVHELIAPDIFPIEVAHALTRAERRGIVKVGHASVLMADVLRTSPALAPYIDLLPRAIELSSQFRIGVYDCLYVALAEQQQCGVVTADSRLISTFTGQIDVVGLADLPS